MQILFSIFIYILQNFMNSFNIEFILFCLSFWLIYTFYRLANL